MKASMPDTPHILLVDDEVLAIMVLEQDLLDEGFRVTTAFDGQEALDHWRHGGFDVLVTDLRMPVMGGDELIRHVRSEHAGFPVVVISGYVTDDVANRLKESLDLPLVIMAKPVGVEAVMDALRKMLAGAE
jgi:two-component system response regulator FlrC